MTEQDIPYAVQTMSRLGTWLLSAGRGRDIWSCLAWSEMEEENPDTGLVSGPGSACTSESVSKEMMLTRMYLI